MEGDAPLEEGHQQHVVGGLEQVDRDPLLVRVDPHDLVAEVLVLAADVRVRVVDVVVGVLPGLGRRRRVPVPGGGVDVGVVHPVPLAVHDVVADLHVLEDLGQRQRRRAGDPGRLVARGEQQHPAEHGEPAVHLDHARDVAPVAVAELGEHVVVDRVELARQRPRPARRSGGPAGSRSSSSWHSPVHSQLDLDRPLGRVDAGADHLALAA